MTEQALRPAAELAALNPIRRPNESEEYRAARQQLLIEEIELRRHKERVAQLRRQLPPGGQLSKTYRFIGENGERTLDQLFEDHSSLVIYSAMFGPQRTEPCPMCTSFIASFATKIADIRQRIGIAFTARSPIERLVDWKRQRGWTDIPLYSDMSGDYTRDYVHPEDDDTPAYNVFTRDGDTIRHFWGDEMTEADPGQDPRGAVEMDPLWLALDSTRDGRGTDWYPKLRY